MCTRTTILWNPVTSEHPHGPSPAHTRHRFKCSWCVKQSKCMQQASQASQASHFRHMLKSGLWQVKLVMQSLSELQSCHVLNYVFFCISELACFSNQQGNLCIICWLICLGHANNEHKTSMDQWIMHNWDQVKWLSNRIILNNAFSSLPLFHQTWFPKLRPSILLSGKHALRTLKLCLLWQCCLANWQGDSLITLRSQTSKQPQSE